MGVSWAMIISCPGLQHGVLGNAICGGEQSQPFISAGCEQDFPLLELPHHDYAIAAVSSIMVAVVVADAAASPGPIVECICTIAL